MITTLHIDAEGGWGGSSRSLYELLSRLDRRRFRPFVVHAKDGPIKEWYQRIGIPTVHLPVVASYVPRKRPVADLALKARELLGTFLAAKSVIELARANGAELIHLNYEGLAPLGWHLRRVGSLPIVTHCRASHLSTGRIGRRFAKLIAEISDHIFFISPQELTWFERCAGSPDVPTSVVWNIARAPHPTVPLDLPLRAVYIGSIDRNKGLDRLVEIAGELERHGSAVAIHAYGEARRDKAYADELRCEIARRGLERRLVLAGYTNDAPRVIAGAVALLRPSLWGDPWGRDVIDATTAGCPVIATGTSQCVIEHGRTGFLVDPYEAGVFAGYIEAIAADAALRSTMSEAARRRGQEQFTGAEQIAHVSETFARLAAVKRSPPVRKTAGAA